MEELNNEERESIDEAGEIPESAYEYSVDLPAIVDYFFNN
jgi:hypothetical protein